MINTTKPRFAKSQGQPDAQSREPDHPALAYLAGFVEPLLKAEPHLWQILEATRMAMKPDEKKQSYMEARAVSNAILARPKLLEAFASHPDVANLSEPRATSEPDARKYIIAHRGAMVRRLAQMGAFRSTKYIIKPHPELEQELFDTELPSEIPVQALVRTPSWGMYLELGQELKSGTVLAPFHGIFVANLLEHGTPVLEMTAVGDGYAADTASVYLSMGSDVKISEALRTMRKYAYGRDIDEKSLPMQIMRYVINMMLYMSSKEPDYDRTVMKLPTPKPSQRGFFYPEPKTPTEVSIGVRLGSALAQAKEQMAQQESTSERGAGRTMPPHVRRAHYHAYRVGPRKIEGTEEEKQALLAKQDYIWHWLPSIPVNVKDFDKLQAVRRAVETVDKSVLHSRPDHSPGT
jgi:hypothetical protein